MSLPFAVNTICSFCGRRMPLPAHASAEASVAICKDCAELAIQMLIRTPASNGEPWSECSFCGTAEWRTAPGPASVAVCAQCARQWLDGVPR